MQNNSLKIISVLAFCISFASCGQNEEPAAKQELIASIHGYELTEAHFESYLKYVEEYAGEIADLKTQIAIKSQLKETFLREPEILLKQLESLPVVESKQASLVEKKKAQRSTAVHQPSKAPMAEGHKVVRDLLGGDIGEMQFDTQAANTFRNYVTNSLLTTTSSNANSGYNSSDYSSSQGQIQFCANGTFVEVLSGHLSIDVEGASALSSGNDAMPGYWEAAALPNDMFIIVMYSTHPRMLEDFPKGFMPFVVTKHGSDFVQLPSGDLYRRTANQYCN